jgi:hypothetical protein
MIMRRIFAISLLLMAASLGAVAQDKTCDPAGRDDCKVEEALHFYVHSAAESAVVNSNRATTAPDAFAARIHNSYQDFLNLLSFAVNDVKESANGEALTVRFNPIRSGNHLFGITLTVAKPLIADAIQNAIPDASRDKTVGLLEKQLGDTDNQAWSGSYSFASSSCLPDSNPYAKCWGRQPKIYMDLLGSLLPAASSLGTDPSLGDRVQELADLFGDEQGDVFVMPVSGKNKEAIIAKIKEIAGLEKASTAPAQALFKAKHFDLFAALIDNQPQITGSASYHQPGRLGGAKERAATLEFHAGRDNINTLRQACTAVEGRADCMQKRLNQLAADGASTDKYVATFTYKKTNSFKLAELPLSDPVADFKPIDLKSSSEYNVKIQAGRQLGTEVMGKPTRADLSFEGIRTENDGFRTKNRWVGTLTISVPFGENMTLPVSLTYANRAEFLGDPNERFGAHFGLSYRLPDLFPLRK